jgi:hypothetical protein
MATAQAERFLTVGEVADDLPAIRRALVEAGYLKPRRPKHVHESPTHAPTLHAHHP